MTRAEMIEKLRSMGIMEIWGRGLTTRTKSELAEYLHHVDGSGVRHLSYSQLNDYMMCGMRYFFKRVDRDAPKFPMPGRVQLGRAYDLGLQTGLEEKQAGADEPNETAMTDAFVQTLHEPSDRIEWQEDESIDRAETQGLALVKLYRSKLIPTIQPSAVQEKTEISFSNREWSVMVIPDLEGTVSDSVQVVDHKIGAKSPALVEAETSDQLTAEAMAYQSKTGKLPDRVAIHRAVTWKKAPKRETAEKLAAVIDTDAGAVGIAKIESARDQARVNRYLKIMDIQVRLISQSIYLPARSGAWPCTPDACEYWQYCHEKF